MADVWQEPTITPWQRNIIQSLVGTLQPAVTPIKNIGTPPGLSGLELTSLAGLEAQAVEGLSGGGSVGTARYGQDVLKEILGMGPGTFEPYFQEAVEQPMLRDYQENIAPSIRRRFAGRDRGSERMAAEGRSQDALLRSLSQARGEMGMNIQQQRLAALGLLPEVSGAEADIFSKYLEAGAVPREVEMEQFLAKERAQERGIRQQQAYLDAIARLTGIPQFENIVEFHPGEQGGGSSGQGWANVGVGLVTAAAIAY